jgi:4-hydroxybenzoate polyprenyltransferase
MGWVAWYGRLDWPLLLLYVGAILWTVGYDTIYAHQDKEDDALIGVRSTARLFGDNTKPWLVGLYAGATVLFAGAYAAAGVGWVAYLGLAAGIAHMVWQVVTLDTGDADNCLVRFRANRDYGALVFAGLLADIALRILG